MRVAVSVVLSLVVLMVAVQALAGGRKPDPDLKELAKLEKAGIDLTQPQHVTFMMDAPARIQDEATLRLKQAGFEVESWSIDALSITLHATRTMVPDLAAIRQVRRDLNALLASLLMEHEKSGCYGWDIPHETPPFQGDVKATGLWVQGNKFLLFAEVVDRPSCSSEYSGASYPQLYVSDDRGRTWRRRGPSMNGNEFTLLSEKDGKVWIAGYHTAEANLDPFLFLPTNAGDNWKVRVSYEESAALDRMAWASNGELIAWIEHIVPAVLTHGPVYIHHSLDGGRTWKILGLARKHAVAVEAEFTKITTQMDPLWRARNFEDFGGVVQHRESESAPWKTVARFPPPPPCQKQP